MEERLLGSSETQKKPYKKPKITLEIELETRAGSTPGPLDPDLNDPSNITDPNF